jgi:hypothetical protein
MATITADPRPPKVELFNNSLETGVRAVVVLNAAFPKAFDLSQLTWLDHLVVHTGDIGGPPSLHPALPQRGGELLVRRPVVERGLRLMRRSHLVDVIVGDGFLYSASESAHPFVEMLRSSYFAGLKERANWLAQNVCSMEPIALEALVSEKIGRWKVEFQEKFSPGSSRHDLL